MLQREDSIKRTAGSAGTYACGEHVRPNQRKLCGGGLIEAGQRNDPRGPQIHFRGEDAGSIRSRSLGACPVEGHKRLWLHPERKMTRRDGVRIWRRGEIEAHFIAEEWKT